MSQKHRVTGVFGHGTTVGLILSTSTVGLAVGISMLSHPAPANADPDCRPLVIGVGGLGESWAMPPTMMDAQLWGEAAQGNRTIKVPYSSLPWLQSVDEGRAADGLIIANYRAECPGGHIKQIGHSEGALVAEGMPADETVLEGNPHDGILAAVLPPAPVSPNTTKICHPLDIVCHPDIGMFVVQIPQYLTPGGAHTYAPNEASEPVVASAPLVYTPTPIDSYIPANAKAFVPMEIRSIVLPPMPEIHIPGLS